MTPDLLIGELLARHRRSRIPSISASMSLAFVSTLVTQTRNACCPPANITLVIQATLRARRSSTIASCRSLCRYAGGRESDDQRLVANRANPACEGVTTRRRVSRRGRRGRWVRGPGSLYPAIQAQCGCVASRLGTRNGTAGEQLAVRFGRQKQRRIDYRLIEHYGPV
jgi:hypothetical protein